MNLLDQETNTPLDYCTIELSRGYSCKVSPEDFEELSKHKWSAFLNHGNSAQVYARRYVSVSESGRVGTTMSMHKHLMKPPNGFVADHISGDTLDNRRGNLRLASYQQNSAHRKNDHRNKSGCRGVFWEKERGKWRAMIRYNRKLIHLGQYDKIEDAIAAREEASHKYFGDFARFD